MTYSRNEAAFKSVETFLDELIHTNENEVIWEVEDSRDFAYRLRQGFFAATMLQKETYANLRYKWIIKEKGNKVIAKRRIVYKATPVGVHKKEFRSIEVSGIITAAINNDHLTTLYFPNSDLTSDDVEMLNKWGDIKGWNFNPETKELVKCQKTGIKQSGNL